MMPGNRILAALSQESRDRLAPHLTLLDFKQGAILHSPGDALVYLYFPIDCLFSVTLTMQDGATAEVGMVGNRELLGITAILGNHVMDQTEHSVQAAGRAMRIDAQIMRQEFRSNEELHDVLLRYTQAFLAQVSQIAACNSLHTLEQRLPRWLLEAQDRLQSDHLPLTQEFMSTMLGVRRAGVTQTAQKLQERKLIQYCRGDIKILNQAGLEASACECFHRIRAEYDRLLGNNKG
ncbi:MULTISPECIES: Crp/Fnr family transcriptional regulator [unclassified Leptolyngbya]|uniref:Crp/Fnr family transcriptional regulator n=1 Tax=unclassified Leptolyngbya TaxID=2650499 RepID=UPI00168A1A0B|nr:MULTISPECIES: Crp/Fnr family transcriptional regulator [unclassified Leptolyngbya]MBD1909156.1 Crp/Fnr family transcriptional regulator [Leptolyngbya sp. FACHB-8]MBD2158464.1 Crp/Fnr family transcriptional regulator [Leptolyngbya sp. FACHB-16]